MIRSEIKNYKTMLIAKQQKYQHSHEAKQTDMNILLDKKILSSDRSRMMERAKFTYSSLRKAFEKRTKTTEVQGTK